MKPEQSRILELLSRNLGLSDAKKLKIIAAPVRTQARILPVLERMDEAQTALYRRILKRHPHYFQDATALLEAEKAGDAAARQAVLEKWRFEASHSTGK